MRAPSALAPLCILPILLGAAVGAESAANGPAPRAVLDEAEYAKRLAAVMAEVDLPALERSHPPTAGMEVVKVEPGSQAGKLGMLVGDHLIDIDGVPVDTIPAYKAARHRDSTQQVTIWNRDTGRRVAKLAPGHEGMWMLPAVPDVEAAYLASSQRSPAWDAAMIAAALTYRIDPELALSALAHAYADGYRGPYLRALQAAAYAAQGKYADAAAATELDLDGVRAADGMHGLRTLYGVALVEGRLADAQQVLTRFPDLRQPTDGFAPYLAELANRQARHASTVDPLTAFATARHYDLTGMMHASRPGEDLTKALRDTHEQMDNMDCAVPLDECFWFEIALPPGDAIACSLQFEATFANALYAEQHVSVSIGDPGDSQDLDDDFRLYAMDYTVRLTVAHQAMVYLRGLPRGTVPVPHRAGLHGTYDLHLARKDGMVAWSLDGQRFGCQPILGKPGPKSLYVYATGCHFILHGMDLDGFDAQPPEGWKPVERKRPAPAAAEVPDPKGVENF